MAGAAPHGPASPLRPPGALLLPTPAPAPAATSDLFLSLKRPLRGSERNRGESESMATERLHHLARQSWQTGQQPEPQSWKGVFPPAKRIPPPPALPQLVCPSLSCLSPKDVVPQPLGTRDPPPQSGHPEILPHFLASFALHQNEPLKTTSVQLHFLSSLFLVGITTGDSRRHLGYQPGDQCAQRVRKGRVFSRAGFRDRGMEGQAGRDCAQGLLFLCQTRRDKQQMLEYLWSQGQDDLDPSHWELGPRSCRGK